MKYYGKTPEQVRQMLEKSGESTRNARKKSRMMQLVNVAMIIGLLLIASRLPQFQRDDKTAVLKKQRQTTRWDQWKILSFCEGKKCEITFTADTDEIKQIDVGTPGKSKSIRWILKEKNNLNPVSEVTRSFVSGKKDGEMYFFFYDLPMELSPDINAYFAVLDEQGEEIFLLRIYPVIY